MPTATATPLPAGASRGTWPPHPRPAATARTVAAGGVARVSRRALAAGVLLAAGTVAIAAVATMLAAFVFLVAAGGDALRVDHGTTAARLLAAGFGLAAAASLVELAGSRPATLALAALAPAAAWLSGHPLPALLAAVLVTGPAIAFDRARPGRRVPAWSATGLALAATACLAASFAAADHGPRLPHVAAAAGARHDAPHRRPHAAAGSPAPAPAPADLVVAYYAALDARRFADAWAVLAPAVRRDFGGFAHWRSGFATTISSRPRRIVATARGGNVWDVRNVLVAHDRSGCHGRLTRRFAVHWRVARTPGGWSVRSLSAAALGPAASPAPCR